MQQPDDVPRLLTRWDKETGRRKAISLCPKCGAESEKRFYQKETSTIPESLHWKCRCEHDWRTTVTSTRDINRDLDDEY